jgi:predicted O-methyltransferase YrrM
MLTANGLWRKETPEGAEIETSELLAALVRHQKPLRCLETGTAWGQTAQHIGQALKWNGRGNLVTCDIESRPEALARIKDLPVEFLQIKGIELIEQQESGLDFVFIDSWWQQIRIEEVHAVIPKMAPGGLLCLHDVSQNYGLVYRAAQESKWPNLVLHTPYGLAIFQAPGKEECIGAGKMVDLQEEKDGTERCC